MDSPFLCINNLTMRFLLFTLIFCLSTLKLMAQEFKVTVVDVKNSPISNVAVLDKNKNEITKSNISGVFIIDKSKFETIGLSKKGYADRWLKLTESSDNEVVIVMDYYYQELNMVNVESEGPENALDINAVNIIDFIPFNESIITLKRHKGTYFIGIDSLGKEGVRHEFNEDRPKRLFIDCLGNMHIVCAEVVYQIAISKSELIIIDKISKNQFNLLLEPCVAKLEDKYVMKSLSSNNQAYSLAIYDKHTDPRLFYYHIDVVSAQVAAEEALKLEFSVRGDVLEDSMEMHILDLRRYVREVYAGENPDVNMDFIQKSMLDGSGNATRWTERFGLFSILTYPINIRSFQIGNQVAVVNFEIDSLSLFDKNGTQLSQVPFSVPSDIKEVWQDLSNDNLYLYTRKNGNHLVYHLDDVTGKTTFLKSMREIGGSKNHRIYDGYLYYLEIDNNFYRIQRVRLPNH